jgi:uncharacterized membrane protein
MFGGHVAGAVAQWAAFYGGHPVVRTIVTFVHVGALLGGGGFAIAADRATLLAMKQDAGARRSQLAALAGTHRFVTIGLSLIVVSGLLLFAADVDTFFHSRVFWIKMGLIVLLLTNGAVLMSAERRAQRGADEAWERLRVTAVASLALWFLVAFAGVALTNVG